MIFRERTRTAALAAEAAIGDRVLTKAHPSDLHRLIYTSEAWAPGAAEHGPQASVNLLASDAATRNSKLGLSGVLVSVRGHFIQILEGDLESLETVFERICRDMRHRALSLVDFSPASEPLFKGWDMIPLDANLMDDPEPFEDLFLSIRGGMAPATIVREVLGFLDAVKPALTNDVTEP